MLLAVVAMASAADMPAASSCDADRIAHLREAVEAHRLTQARRMAAMLAPTCAEMPDYRFLAAVTLLESGDAEQAINPLATLAEAFPDRPAFAAAAGRAALRLGRDDVALNWLGRAAALSDDDWRTWNAIGVLRDRRGEWAAAGQAYARAAEIAPDEAAIWNNRGYSLVLQGQAMEALPFLDRALALDSGNGKMRRTRDLARALAGMFDDRRRPGESAAIWSQRLNNQGYAAWLAGRDAAARRLLTKAIEARATRFDRAEANLSRMEAHR